MILEHMPTREELSFSPEMAALAALDFTLDLATRALSVAQPELCQDRIPRTKLEAVICGYRLLHLAIRTQVALARYRQAVSPDRPVPPNATDDLDMLSEED